jgi:hypothetical protein
LCGLPVRRLRQGELLYERRNGQFILQVAGHPDYGVPFGQDRLVPIFLATLAVRQQSQTIRFRTASEMLETFGMHKGGKEYRRRTGQRSADQRQLVEDWSSCASCCSPVLPRGRSLPCAITAAAQPFA